MSVQRRPPTKSREKAPAEDIASNLFQIMVVEEPSADFTNKFDVPPNLVPQFRARLRLYREAVVLMVLLQRAKQEENYENVLRSYEALLFGNTPDAASMAKLKVVRSAMADLSDLVNPTGQPKQLTWSRQWFAAFGRNETNPATLTLLAMHWMNYYEGVLKTVSELEPD